MSQASKEGWLKYKVFLDAYSKANPRLKRATQIENAQLVKDDQEKKNQMMSEFRANEASNNSKLLGSWGRDATPTAGNPPNPANFVQAPAATPVQIEPIPTSSTSSSGIGKYIFRSC